VDTAGGVQGWGGHNDTAVFTPHAKYETRIQTKMGGEPRFALWFVFNCL